MDSRLLCLSRLFFPFLLLAPPIVCAWAPWGCWAQSGVNSAPCLEKEKELHKSWVLSCAHSHVTCTCTHTTQQPNPRRISQTRSLSACSTHLHLGVRELVPVTFPLRLPDSLRSLAVSAAGGGCPMEKPIRPPIIDTLLQVAEDQQQVRSSSSCALPFTVWIGLDLALAFSGSLDSSLARLVARLVFFPSTSVCHSITHHFLFLLIFFLSSLGSRPFSIARMPSCFSCGPCPCPWLPVRCQRCRRRPVFGMLAPAH